MDIESELNRTCAHCRETKAITEFGMDRAQPLGRTYRCKPCKNQSQRDRLAVRPLATCHSDRRTYARGLCKTCYSKEYYSKNTAKRVQSVRAWKETHPEEHKKQLQLYATRHPDKIRESRANYRSKHPEKARDSRLRLTYHISQEDYNRMYEVQEGKCAICNIPKKLLDVDHNHETGQVRGLLCNPCNRVLGAVERAYGQGATIDAFFQYLNREKKVPQGVYG